MRSVTQSGYEVGVGEVFKNEKLEVSDWTTGPLEDDDDNDDENDENEDEESTEEED